MMSIFDDYTAAAMREIFREPTNSWPEDFICFVNDELSDDLLDQWLENHSDEEYRAKVKDIIESITYGYEDEDGNEMLEFDEFTENDGQMRLF
jgi:hypothetical protein